MKTTSSKLYRGVMLIAVLLVPATTWWASVRYYNAHKQTEETTAPVPKTEMRYAAQREQMLKDVKDEDTIESLTATRVPTIWTGPTDPDNVWHGQLQQANKTLIQHHLPVLSPSYGAPPSRRLPAR